ncbi:nuclear pore complex protein Nup88 [Tribolium castaneum]|uniref:nuclear pore complex protein Nup88 n=1 Tax=Tribolium castaneum TaxID=7070 RepID=UPI00046C2212|nr:PREDICTED: nuclear pore complex protein Nup88 isoform X2 [Tribolium castaneum]|eukprot:XP_001809287.2 PREDICTED: nuclear pore complex protein Nup88 isoform X2 [Tribolium castaneum]
MDSTDYLGLSKIKILKNVREAVPEKLKKSINLLAVKYGVLFTWDFANNCVLTLNIKAARSNDGDNVTHQNLFPVLPVMFQPELLLVNDTGTLLLVAGPSGIIVMELPAMHLLYGADSRDVVFCRTHTLDERLLICSDVVQVRQVRFHPGSPRNTHIVALTSDNTLRLYNIENRSAVSVSKVTIGETPIGVFPGTKTSFLAAFGEVGVDFDFGQPEITKSPTNDETQELQWPVFVLRGDGSVYSVTVPLEPKAKWAVKGPLPQNTPEGNPRMEACAIICLNTNPEVVCIANSNGTILHSIVLPLDHETRELLCFESIELELGLSTTTDDNSYTCPIFLHKDESKSGRFCATHSAGVHLVTVGCVKDLQEYVNGQNEEQALDEIFNCESKAEYLVCTKTSNSEKTNPVIGFSLYYEPTSLIAILADGNLVTLGILTAEVLPQIGDLPREGVKDEATSPLKKMLREPVDVVVERLLKRSSNQPILKLGGDGKHSQKDCHELLQRASKFFRESFENHTRAREEIEKRAKVLQVMMEFQLKQIQRMNNEKHQVQAKAESLAEKYEDIKDKHDVIMKRCEKMLVLVSQKKAEPSDAEKEYLKELEQYMEKIEKYKKSIEKLKMKMNYQKIQIANWKAQEEKKVPALSETHSLTIKDNLKKTSEKIAEMVKEINEYKERLNLNFRVIRTN